MEERELYKDLYAELEKIRESRCQHTVEQSAGKSYADCYGTYGKRGKCLYERLRLG